MKLALKIVLGVIGLLAVLKLAQYGIDYLYQKYGRRYISAGEND